MSMNSRAQLRQFLLRRFPHAQLTDDQDIFALGFATSLFAMELVLFVEKQLGVQVSNSDLRIDNFRSVDAVVALVERTRLAAETASTSR